MKYYRVKDSEVTLKFVFFSSALFLFLDFEAIKIRN